MGARNALQQIERKINEAVKDPQPADADSGLVTAIKNLPETLNGLAPDAAASAWLKVYDQWIEQMANSGGEQNDFGFDIQASAESESFSSLIQNLPNPSAWQTLSDQIDARKIEGNRAAQIRGQALRMLGHRLISSNEKLKLDVAAAQSLLETKKKKSVGEGLLSLLGGGNQDQSDDWTVQLLREQIQTIQLEIDPVSAIEAFSQLLSDPDQRSHGYLVIPNLVEIAGQEKASPLIEKALLLEGVQLTFSETNTKTIALARDLARKNLDQIKLPQWALCYSIDASDLYAAFVKLDSTGNNIDSNAKSWYIAGLIINGRGDDVIRFMVEQDDESNDASEFGSRHYGLMEAIEQAGHSRRLSQFLKNALTAHPELQLWDTYVAVAAKQGRSDEVIRVVNEVLKRDTLPTKTRRIVEKIRADALLANDQIEEAMTGYLAILDAAKNDESLTEISDASTFNIAVRVAETGRLVGNPQWLNTGLDTAEEIIRNVEDNYAFNLSDVIGPLCDVGHFARAEQLLIDRIAPTLAQQAAQADGDALFNANWQEMSLQVGSDAEDSAPGLLLQVYHLANRPKDVIALLQESPWWGQGDLADFISPDISFGGGHGERPSFPIPYLAAKALADDGQSKLARPIAEAVVLSIPSYDPGWKLAIELTGDEFPELANRVFARDQFEERPLIWLARYHLSKGSLAEAEEQVRNAISIDPSDGEQGRDDRMRAYAILAEILQKKGDLDSANIYQGAMRAIRTAELADQFYVNGMLTRGLKMYRESLEHFADAYCIQSRLAVQLASKGDLEGATKHYQRAYELMPDSFGRVESHCFGCEGVFDGDLAQGIAENVFTKLAAEYPKNARVQYLIGYLRENQNRHAEAAMFFRKAIQLDPDYLNAWSKLTRLEGEPGVTITQEERDEASFALLRLDPQGQRGGGNVSGVRNLAKLWSVLHDAAERVPELKFENLFPLTASLKQRDSQKTDEFGLNQSMYFSNTYYGSRTAFTDHETLQAIASLMDSAGT